MTLQSCLLVCVAMVGRVDPEGAELLRFVHASHMENVRAFSFGEFEFTITHEGGPSLPAGLSAKAHGRYAFDGVNSAYECLYDAAAVVASTRKNDDGSVSIPLQSRRMLQDGKSTLLDLMAPDLETKTIFHTPQIFEDPDASQFLSWFLFPISIGCPDKLEPRLCRDLAKALGGDLELESVEVDQASGRSQTVRLMVSRQGVKRAYVVDVERGGLPLEARDIGPDGREVASTTLEGIVHLDGRGWFPTRQTMMRRATGERITIDVTRSNVSQRPARGAFHLRFDPPRSILDPQASISYENCADFSLLSRPGFNAGARRVVIPKAPEVLDGTDVVMPGEAAPSRFGYLSVGAASLILIGAWAVLLRWKARRA